MVQRISLEYLPPSKLSLTWVQPFMPFDLARTAWSQA